MNGRLPAAMSAGFWRRFCVRNVQGLDSVSAIINKNPCAFVTAVAQTPITRQSNFIPPRRRRRISVSWILPLLLVMLC
jgi:hypothetical protein